MAGDALLFGRFRVESKLGSGGMSVVYRATEGRGRVVALKVLRHEGLSEEVIARRRLRMGREAQALRMISHPNVVRVYEVGAADDQVFISMEYIEGITLKRWLAEAQPSLERIAETFVAAGRGLMAAHRAGIVHRDVKPDNIMVQPNGRVVVTDFGLARVDTGAELASLDGPLAMPLTRTGAVLGTPRYMAPEQHQGLPADARTDQFSFCLCLYEALYGESPFRSDTRSDLPADLAYALEVVRGRLKAPPANRGVPAEIHGLVVQGLRADPAERHASLEPIVLGLHRWVAKTERPRFSRWAVGGGLLGALLTVAALSRDRRPPDCDRPPAVPAGLPGLLGRLSDPERRAAEAAIEGHAAGLRVTRQKICANGERREERLLCVARREAELELAVAEPMPAPLWPTALRLAAPVDWCLTAVAESEAVGATPLERLWRAAAGPRSPAWLQSFAALAREAERREATVVAPPVALSGETALEVPTAVGLLLVEKGRSAEAARVLARVPEPALTDPRISSSLRLDAEQALLRANAEIGDLPRARRAAEAAAALVRGGAPDVRASVLLTAAVLFARAGAPAEAERALEEARSVRPPDDSTLDLVEAFVARSSGDLAGAARAEPILRRVIARERDRDPVLTLAALLELGWIRLAHGAIDDAHEVLLDAQFTARQRFGERDPRLADALLSVGMVDLEAGRLTSALDRFERARALFDEAGDAGPVEARLMLARALAVQGGDDARVATLLAEARARAQRAPATEERWRRWLERGER